MDRGQIEIAIIGKHVAHKALAATLARIFSTANLFHQQNSLCHLHFVIIGVPGQPCRRAEGGSQGADGHGTAGGHPRANSSVIGLAPITIRCLITGILGQPSRRAEGRAEGAGGHLGTVSTLDSGLGQLRFVSTLQVFLGSRAGGQQVALKVLAATAQQAATLGRLKREVALLQRVSYDANVVQFYGAALQHAADAVLVMECASSTM